MKYIHETTCAFHAGKLSAILYNRYNKRKDLPSIILCMRDFMNLKIVFGKYYNLLKNNKKLFKYNQSYEMMVNSLDLSNNTIGDYSDFMIGYASCIHKKKLDYSINSSN